MSTLAPLLALSAAAAFMDPPPLTPTQDSYAMLSPDGRTLLFQSNRSGRTALYKADADGKNLRVFLDSGDNPSVAVWSPDGARIAFVAEVDKQTEIFVMRADGSGRTRLTQQPGDDSHPHWSADGQRIFFNSARGTPDPSLSWDKQFHDIYSFRADGTDVRRHTDCKTICTYPVPSPDGKRIAYRKMALTPGINWALGMSPRNSEVFVADLDGGNERNLTNHAAYDGWPMWSPDGSWIAFSSARVGRPNAGQIFVVRPDGKDLRQITDSGASYTQHSWAPDGQSLYLTRTWEALDWSWEHGHITRISVPQVDLSQAGST